MFLARSSTKPAASANRALAPTAARSPPPPRDPHIRRGPRRGVPAQRSGRGPGPALPGSRILPMAKAGNWCEEHAEGPSE